MIKYDRNLHFALLSQMFTSKVAFTPSTQCKNSINNTTNTTTTNYYYYYFYCYCYYYYYYYYYAYAHAQPSLY